jgi:uncharacterized glyoxalase superfamily protein PhnB
VADAAVVFLVALTRFDRSEGFRVEIDVLGPESRGGATSSIVLQAADTDAVVAQAVSAGATVLREPKDEPYGRMATLADPFGHRWMIHGPAKA